MYHINKSCTFFLTCDFSNFQRSYYVMMKMLEDGKGRWSGGDGVTREIVFRRTVQLSVLTERRAFQPYGMNGGEPGERGLNLLQRTDGRIINLGGKASVEAYPGDKYIMNSPGGGGFGLPTDESTGDAKTDQKYNEFLQRGSLYEYKSAQESV